MLCERLLPFSILRYFSPFPILLTLLLQELPPGLIIGALLPKVVTPTAVDAGLLLMATPPPLPPAAAVSTVIPPFTAAAAAKAAATPANGGAGVLEDAAAAAGRQLAVGAGSSFERLLARDRDHGRELAIVVGPWLVGELERGNVQLVGTIEIRLRQLDGRDRSARQLL